MSAAVVRRALHAAAAAVIEAESSLSSASDRLDEAEIAGWSSRSTREQLRSLVAGLEALEEAITEDHAELSPERGMYADDA